MKKYILPSLKLTAVFIVLCAGIYPLLLAGVGKMTPGQGRGKTLSVGGKVVGYANIGQHFSADITLDGIHHDCLFHYRPYFLYWLNNFFNRIRHLYFWFLALSALVYPKLSAISTIFFFFR